MKHSGDAGGGDDERSGRKTQRGGAGRGQGRKALAGEVRKVRPFKATDAEWEDFKLVTPEKVRQWVAKQAAKLRKAEET